MGCEWSLLQTTAIFGQEETKEKGKKNNNKKKGGIGHKAQIKKPVYIYTRLSLIQVDKNAQFQILVAMVETYNISLTTAS